MRSLLVVGADAAVLRHHAAVDDAVLVAPVLEAAAAQQLAAALLVQPLGRVAGRLGAVLVHGLVGDLLHQTVQRDRNLRTCIMGRNLVEVYGGYRAELGLVCLICLVAGRKST